MSVRRALHASWLLVLACMFVTLSAGCAEPDGSVRDKPGRGLYVRAVWQQARGIQGHYAHVVEQKVACSKCHDMTGKEIDEPTAAACSPACHEAETKSAHAGVPSDCLSCHAFTLEEGWGEAPHVWDCMRCHASPQGDTPAVSIHFQSTCDSCHRPHETPSVTGSDCQSCHEHVVTQHASAGKEPAAVCTTCHADQHALAAAARFSCADCHAKAEPIVPATALFEGHAECTGCHRPHAYEAAQAVPCRKCHEDVPVLGGGRIEAHANCESCHQAHDVGGAIDAACAKCHQGAVTDHPGMKGPAGGTACATCHDAHPTTKAAGARACSDCHHDASNDKAFHGSACVRCHTPHRFSLAAATTASLCQRCHGAEVTAALRVDGHAECASCHNGLPHQPATQLADCARCHASVASSVVAGHAGCRKCHEPHSGDQLQACGACHAQQQRAAPAGHQKCASCHDAHTASVRKTCASCHASQAASDHANVPGGCAKCHSAHGEGVSRPPACGSCHQRSALPGLHQQAAHQTCSQCHLAHGKPFTSERALCLTCHADMADHQSRAERCNGCHLFR